MLKVLQGMFACLIQSFNFLSDEKFYIVESIHLQSWRNILSLHTPNIFSLLPDPEEGVCYLKASAHKRDTERTSCSRAAVLS